jgi:hypothetical protein
MKLSLHWVKLAAVFCKLYYVKLHLFRQGYFGFASVILGCVSLDLSELL